jgi:hypothetical protein
MTKPPTIVTYRHRPKRARKPAQARQSMPTAIVTARKPGKDVWSSEPVMDGDVSESVKAFFKRMVRPRDE